MARVEYLAHLSLRGPIFPGSHFMWEEARCRHCRKLPRDVAPIINAARMMEKVREVLGGHPIIPNSWCRCPEYNARIGGASNSQHMYGRAVDFGVKAHSPREVQQILSEHRDVVRGLGRYAGFTHCDNRPGEIATWDG
jgi:uncharacterized protein YcbK (DUF882 family)